MPYTIPYESSSNRNAFENLKYCLRNTPSGETDFDFSNCPLTDLKALSVEQWRDIDAEITKLTGRAIKVKTYTGGPLSDVLNISDSNTRTLPPVDEATLKAIASISSNYPIAYQSLVDIEERLQERKNRHYQRRFFEEVSRVSPWKMQTDPIYRNLSLFPKEVYNILLPQCSNSPGTVAIILATINSEEKQLKINNQVSEILNKMLEDRKTHEQFNRFLAAASLEIYEVSGKNITNTLGNYKSQLDFYLAYLACMSQENTGMLLELNMDILSYVTQDATLDVKAHKNKQNILVLQLEAKFAKLKMSNPNLSDRISCFAKIVNKYSNNRLIQALAYCTIEYMDKNLYSSEFKEILTLLKDDDMYFGSSLLNTDIKKAVLRMLDKIKSELDLEFGEIESTTRPVEGNLRSTLRELQVIDIQRYIEDDDEESQLRAALSYSKIRY